VEEKEEIKKSHELYLYYWIIPVFIGLVLINYFANILKLETFDIDLMVSIVTFLFGFFITISFSMILARVGTLKISLAEETGRLVSLFSLSKHLGKKFSESLGEIIDKYTVKTLRYYSNYDLSRDEVNEIYSICSLMELKSELQKQMSASFFYVLGEFEPTREKLEYLTKGRLIPAMKIVNYLLATILIILLFLNRGDTLSNFIFIVLSTSVIFILLIIEDYEDLRIGDYINNISNSEQLFDLVGKERYYPEKLVGRVKLENGRKYRIGVYNPKTKEEKMFLITYNKNFHINFKNVLTKVLGRKKAEEIKIPEA